MEKDPANFVVKLLGGASAVSSLIGKDVSSVLRWKLPKAKRGAGGRIPLANLFTIWCSLVKEGHPVTLEQVVFTESEQAELLALREEVFQERQSSAPEFQPLQDQNHKAEQPSPRKSPEFTQ